VVTEELRKLHEAPPVTCVRLVGNRGEGESEITIYYQIVNSIRF